MDVWHAYIDESYNTRTFCVGCILARPEVATEISGLLSKRIAYENRMSVKRGFDPISRYHATDCAGLKREFGSQNGWNISRQAKLTKRLCEILGDHPLTGFVVGGSIGDIANHCGPGSDPPKDLLYSMSFRMCLLGIASTMRSYVIDPKVEVFFERGEFESVARESFELTRSDPRPEYRCFANAEVKGWNECVALQWADFMAYEGFRRIDKSLQGDEVVRRSLQAMLRRTHIVVQHFQESNFVDIQRMIQNVQTGRPRHEGITSGLVGCHGTVPYLPK